MRSCEFLKSQLCTSGSREDEWHEPELGLASELGLWKNRHVDDIPTPHPVHLTLSTSAELGSLHADDRLTLVQGYRATREVAEEVTEEWGEDSIELSIERVSEHGMSDYSKSIKVRGWADSLSPINDRVTQNEIAWCDLLTQGSDGGEGYDGLDSDRLESCDVGAGGDARGGD